jgi:hypothetical protein
MIETANPVLVPWGESELPLLIPPAWRLSSVTEPDLTGPLADYTSALQHALDHPLGSPRLENMVTSRATVAIVVDDPSRWTPVRDALPVVLRRLEDAGVARDGISISVGVGRHHAVDPEGMRRRVGADVASAYRCYSPPVDDLSQYVHLGKTPEGVPVRVFRPVADATLRIMIGSVLPHLQAGFGGGYKLIFPGTSHRSTLGSLHRQGLGGAAGRLLGRDADTNPMRRAIRSAAALLSGPCVSISHVMGEPSQVFRIAAGDPSAVQDALAAEARRRFEAPPGAADVIIASNHPWPGDPMQSFKVLLDHRAACRRGGVLVGFFWTDRAEIDRSFPLPAMRAVAASGAFGGWLARRGLSAADSITSALGSSAAFMVRWARELVLDRTVMVYSPVLCEQIGPRLGPIEIFADQRPLWSAVERFVVEPTVRAFPRGGLTYCPQDQGEPNAGAP